MTRRSASACTDASVEIFDSHAHYNDARFEAEYPGGMEGALHNAYQAGVRWIVNVGTSPVTSAASLSLSERYDWIFAAVGIHPIDALEIPESAMPEALDAIRRQSAHPKAVALGEIGLDYYWDSDNRAGQKHLFDLQLSMAEELDLPVIVHDRDAHGDTFDIVRAHPNVRGVFHSYSGSAEMARQLCALGWYVSFSGPITYKNAHGVREAAAAVPRDRVLVETDAPYLPPVPHRGEINYSGYLPFTIRALAQAIGLDEDETAACTAANAKRLFSVF